MNGLERVDLQPQEQDIAPLNLDLQRAAGPEILVVTSLEQKGLAARLTFWPLTANSFPGPFRVTPGSGCASREFHLWSAG